MRAYLSILKLSIINGVQYRAAALAGIVTQFFWGFIFIMIYEAFYSSIDTSQTFTLDQLITYIWLQQSFLVFIMLWIKDEQLFSMITSGSIAYELSRPCGIYGLWYARLLAQRISGALLRCFPILIVAFLLPKPYSVGLPAGLPSFILFLITLSLGLLILVAISMFIYISTFITMSPAGSLLMFSVAGEFFAGLVIPVPLMPIWLQRITYMLPFRLTADLPFRIYTGNISVYDALASISIQLLWLGILVVSGNAAMNKVLKRVVVQGG